MSINYDFISALPYSKEYIFFESNNKDVFYCETKHTECVCPHCKKITTEVKDRRLQSMQMVAYKSPTNIARYTYRVYKKRFYCPKCKQSFAEPLPGVARYQRVCNDIKLCIIIDCSDPIGPGEGLFTREFYKSAFEALREDGLIVQQSESPIVQQHLVHEIFTAMRDVFPIVRSYYSHVPIYPECMHSFMLASKKYDPLTAEPARKAPEPMRYYNEAIQKSCYALPNFYKECLYEGKISF